jgi:hypothetical protein
VFNVVSVTVVDHLRKELAIKLVMHNTLRHFVHPGKTRHCFKAWTVKNSAVNKAGGVETLSDGVEIVPSRISVYKLRLCSTWRTEPKYSDDEGYFRAHLERAAAKRSKTVNNISRCSRHCGDIAS